MSEIVFLLEELSMEEMLKELLPRICPIGVRVRYIKFEGKQDLERGMTKKLRGYLVPNAQFVILRDQDSGNCMEIKEHLKVLCHQAGKPDVTVRIVCRELESWYLGDLAAVESAFGIGGLSNRQSENIFRRPDNHNNAKQILRKLTSDRYRPKSSSREIGKYLNPGQNTSHSFRVFVESIKRIAVAT